MEFTVSVTFECMTAKDPLDAAKKAAKWLLDDCGAEFMIYDVVNEETKEEFTVDLSEEYGDAVLPK